MKIESSTIGLASQHTNSRQVTVEESLRAWVGPQRPDFEGHAAQNRSTPRLTVATISDAARQAAAQAVAIANPAANTQSSADAQATAEAEGASDHAGNDPKMQLLINLIESLTGQKVRLFNPNELKPGDAAQAHSQKTAEAAQSAQDLRQGWGVEYDRHETVRESERTAFAAEGVIRTSDGKDIRFQLSLEMKRDFFRENNVSVREGDGVRKDPLVVNFSGSAAQLTDTKFGFDLDSDGKAEKMSFVGGGSGFLALDRNGNGIIDNGSELFGTQSGNGFADLSAYDGDKNNWIDENDAVYSRLLVWSKDAAGKDILSTLAQRNVGALYLGNIATPFDLKNSSNDLQGQVRGSGIYLREDGSAGALQQIDLIV
ncbi:hypothetical protein [Candidatus Ferrigenium straubiae]|uniref:hypothetical protein n=1 Tax=Candidatus Ferrigenium straubiae TaxID=2919506 RepID=UPI003F4ADDB0